LKWFKHLTASGEDPDILEAMELFGDYGYVVFFRTLEIMGREFNIKKPGFNDFSMRFLSKKYTKSWKKTEKVLLFFQKKKRIFFKKYRRKNGRRYQERVMLNCPKLRVLCDEYADKRLKGRMKKNRDRSRDIRKAKIGSNRNRTQKQKKTIIKTNPPVGGLDFIDKAILKAETIRDFSEKLNKKINIYAWINFALNMGGHPQAILDSMDALINQWAKNANVNKPWAYLNATFKVKNGNYWEDHHIKESQRFKKVWTDDRDIQEMVSRIGNIDSENAGG